MKEYKVVCELSSKDKKVFKVEHEDKIYVLKEYSDEQAALKEVQAVKKIALTGYAPEVIEYENNKAVYEYIDGENLHDAFRKATMLDDKQGMELLATRLLLPEAHGVLRREA